MKKRQRPYPHYKFPDEIIIAYTKMSIKECAWFNMPNESYELTTVNYGWFPTEAIMGVIKGKYEDTNEIGAAIRGNLGTASIGVVNIAKAIELLTKSGYTHIQERERLTDEA